MRRKVDVFARQVNNEKGIKFYDPIPYLFVSVTDKCVSTATVITIPGEERLMKFKNGWGSSTLSATFTNGMLTTVGQANDPKIPETLTSIAALGTAFLTEETKCKPSAILYAIENGVPNVGKPINVLVEQ